MRAIHGAEIDLAPVVTGERAGDGRPVVGGERAGGAGQVAEGCTAGVRARHLTLLVRDARGWSNLCRILTFAHAHTREGRERGEPSVRWRPCSSTPRASSA